MAARKGTDRREPARPEPTVPETRQSSRVEHMRAILVEYFAAEGFAAGDRLPSEEKLAAIGGVGRSTTREALKLLEQEGLVTSHQGKGRFLSSLGTLRVERPITRYESQTDLLGNLGVSFETVTLSVKEVPASKLVKAELGLEPASTVIRIERLRSSKGEPLIYTVCHIPRWCIEGPIKHVNWAGSLNDLLAAQGLAPASSIARMTATTLDAEVSEAYSLGEWPLWLLIEETVVTDRGERVMHALDYHRGDRFAFNVLRRP